MTPGRTKTRSRPPARSGLLIFAFVGLAFGVVGGLMRLGVGMPFGTPELVLLHGPLMVGGFFGALISLERAVALERAWAYAAPGAAAGGMAALLLGAPLWLGALMMTTAGGVLFAASLSVYFRQKAVFTATLTAGAAAWTLGNALWLGGQPVHHVVDWWVAFLVLTIAAERLELSRLAPPSQSARWVFAAGVVVLLVAVGGGLTRLMGAALAAGTVWLAAHDIARRTIRTRGLPRYSALALLSGYAWLGVAGVLFMIYGQNTGYGPAYDASLHAIFLGFVFAMVFGHAPIILPAVTRLRVPYHPIFHVHLALLHVSLLARIVGDLAGVPWLRREGGVCNAVAIGLFVVVTAVTVIRARCSRPSDLAQQTAR